MDCFPHQILEGLGMSHCRFKEIMQFWTIAKQRTAETTQSNSDTETDSSRSDEHDINSTDLSTINNSDHIGSEEQDNYWSTDQLIY